MNYKNKFKKHYNLCNDDLVYCKVCGTIATDIHHIIYKSQGGTDDIGNLVPLCRSCHDRAHYKKEPYIAKEYLQELNEKH